MSNEYNHTIHVAFNELASHNAVENLFPIGQQVYGSILESMKEGGFNEAYPLQAVAGNGTYYVFDGLTRMKACKELKLEKIPVFVEKNDMTDEDIRLKAIQIQSNRRSSNDEVQFACIGKLSEMAALEARQRRGIRNDLNAENKPAKLSANAAIARIINKSETYVKQAKAIMKDELLKEKVFIGELSMDAAYKTCSREGKNKAENETQPPVLPKAENETQPPVLPKEAECTSNAPAGKNVTVDSPKTEAGTDVRRREIRESRINVLERFLKEVLLKLASVSDNAMKEMAELAPSACAEIIKEVQESIEKQKKEATEILRVA